MATPGIKQNGTVVIPGLKGRAAVTVAFRHGASGVMPTSDGTHVVAGAARVPLLFPAWYVGVARYAADDRVERGGRLYRCLQTHQPRLGTEPEGTPSLWEPIEG